MIGTRRPLAQPRVRSMPSPSGSPRSSRTSSGLWLRRQQLAPRPRCRPRAGGSRAPRARRAGSGASAARPRPPARAAPGLGHGTALGVPGAAPAAVSTRNTAPPPSRFSARDACPPCASTMPRQMGSPRPAPAAAVVRRGRTSRRPAPPSPGGKPGPRSAHLERQLRRPRGAASTSIGEPRGRVLGGVLQQVDEHLLESAPGRPRAAAGPRARWR